MGARLQTLHRGEVMRIIDHMAQVMEHLAYQREDVTVDRLSGKGEHGFTVRLATEPPNPLIAEQQ